MASESGEGRPARAGGTGTKPTEAEQLPCPRCDSTNTKFCYYNNYNLSQPRYFCKSCRRYWTQGGTLRNVPVGGGTRKSSSYKRPRTTTTTTTSDSTSISTLQVQDSIHASMISEISHGSRNGLGSGPYLGCEVNLNEALPETGSFSSLLTTRVGNGFMSWPGYGLGLGPGLHGMGFGLDVLDWPMEPVGQGDGGGAAAGGGGNAGGNVSGCNTWQMGGGFDDSLADGDCFGWTDLAISTPGKGLK